MATDWVVDASIAVKLFLAEPDSEQARALLDKISVDGRLLAPSLLRYEVGNAVARKGAPADLDDRLQDALALVERVEPVAIATRQGTLSYYDGAYIALAVEQEAGLLTADDDMRKAAKRLGVPVQP